MTNLKQILDSKREKDKKNIIHLILYNQQTKQEYLFGYLISNIYIWKSNFLFQKILID